MVLVMNLTEEFHTFFSLSLSFCHVRSKSLLETGGTMAIFGFCIVLRLITHTHINKVSSCVISQQQFKPDQGCRLQAAKWQTQKKAEHASDI